jgi:hypothetical protein
MILICRFFYKTEREYFEIGLELKMDYHVGKLNPSEIKICESLPQWSWQFTEDELPFVESHAKKYYKKEKDGKKHLSDILTSQQFAKYRLDMDIKVFKIRFGREPVLKLDLFTDHVDQNDPICCEKAIGGDMLLYKVLFKENPWDSMITK